MIRFQNETIIANKSEVLVMSIVMQNKKAAKEPPSISTTQEELPHLGLVPRRKIV